MRHLDYRDTPAAQFDAVSSIGLTEHLGRAALPSYFRFLASRLRPGGRLLNHCITQNRTPRHGADPFIDRYVFPDGQLHAIGHLVSVMNDNGFEIRHEENLREHYAMTLRDWGATSRSTGTRPWPRSARAGRGCGGSTWPRAGWASSATTSSCTRCWARSSATGESGFPLRGW